MGPYACMLRHWPVCSDCFISGCDSGFGLELAQKLASLGYHVIAGCLSESSDGAVFLKEAVENAAVIKCDVTSDDDVERVKAFADDHVRRTGNGR